MRAEDIKVGMWVRDPGGDVCKTSRQSEIVRGWHVEYPNGRLHTWPSEQLEPCGSGSLRSLTTSKPPDERVTMVDTGRGVIGAVFAVLGDSVAADLSGVEVPVDRFEDANDAFAEAIRRAAAMQRAEAQKAKSLAQPSAASADANTTCVHCGGMAYLGLQEARCLAPKCERVEPEPEVRELWVGFRHEKRPGERGIRDALLAPMGPEYERWWQATGRGVTKNHPIREEAIRLWREAVSRG